MMLPVSRSAGEDRASLLSPGTQVKHFQVNRLLGRGGMGEVYLARDTQLGRKVALKVIKPDFVRDRAALLRFLQEARPLPASIILISSRFTQSVNMKACHMWR